MISFSSQTVRAWKEDEYDPRTMVLQIEKDKYLLQTDAKLGTHKIYGEDAQDEEPPVVLVDEHEYNDGPLPFTQAGAQASGYEYVDGAINDKTLSHVYVQAGFQAATDEEGPPPPLPPLPAWCSQPASRSPSATKQAAALTINVDNDGDGKDEDEENGYMVPQTLTPEYEMAILTQSREMTRGAAAFKTAPAASAASAASLVVHGQSHEIMSSGSCQPISPMETRMEMQAFCLPKPSKQPSYATVAEVPPPSRQKQNSVGIPQESSTAIPRQYTYEEIQDATTYAGAVVPRQYTYEEIANITSRQHNVVASKAPKMHRPPEQTLNRGVVRIKSPSGKHMLLAEPAKGDEKALSLRARLSRTLRLGGAPSSNTTLKRASPNPDPKGTTASASTAVPTSHPGRSTAVTTNGVAHVPKVGTISRKSESGKHMFFTNNAPTTAAATNRPPTFLNRDSIAKLTEEQRLAMMKAVKSGKVSMDQLSQHTGKLKITSRGSLRLSSGGQSNATARARRTVLRPQAMQRTNKAPLARKNSYSSAV